MYRHFSDWYESVCDFNRDEEMNKNVIQVWWHCLFGMWKGHRMCRVTNFKNKSWWGCSCGFGDRNGWIIGVIK